MRATCFRIVALCIILAILTSGLPQHHKCQDTDYHDNTCDHGYACTDQIQTCSANEPTHAHIITQTTQEACAACQFSLLAKSTGAGHGYTCTHLDNVIIRHPFTYEPVILVCPYLVSHPLRAPPRLTG